MYRKLGGGRVPLAQGSTGNTGSLLWLGTCFMSFSGAGKCGDKEWTLNLDLKWNQIEISFR